MTDKQRPIGSGFTAASTVDEVLEGIDLSGKNVVVTGGHVGRVDIGQVDLLDPASIDAFAAVTSTPAVRCTSSSTMTAIKTVVEDTSFRGAAQRMSPAIVTEDGVGRVLATVESLARRP